MSAVKAPWQRKFRRCAVLSDHELQALREIERRLRWTSPELIRLFNSVEPLPDEEPPQTGARGCWWPRPPSPA